MSFLERLFSVPEKESVSRPSVPLTKVPANAWVRVKLPRKMLSSVDSNLGGVVRVQLRDGVPIFFEPISTIDYLSEQDFSYTSEALARRKVVEI